MTLKLDISGLDDLRATLNSNRVAHEVQLEVGSTLRKIHNAYERYIAFNYGFKESLKSLLTVKTISTASFGRSSLLGGGLEYNLGPSSQNLARLPYKFYWGNINPAVRKGRVHTVKLNPKFGYQISYGKLHHGGFTFPHGSKKMVERQETRTHFKELRTITISSTINALITYDNVEIPRLDDYLIEFEQKVLDRVEAKLSGK